MSTKLQHRRRIVNSGSSFDDKELGSSSPNDNNRGGIYLSSPSSKLRKGNTPLKQYILLRWRKLISLLLVGLIVSLSLWKRATASGIVQSAAGRGRGIFSFTRSLSKPRLPVAGVDIPVPNATEWPLIHIVNTRFMQQQGPLTTLGMARFRLFMTFCFPTMIHQTSQNFFWIIKTDPLFTETEVFQQLLKEVKDYPNIYVVASNNNFPSSAGAAWRDGAEGMDLLRSTIYTGNITELHQAIALRNDRPILETRLDADDGLHIQFIEYIQLEAVERFRILDKDNNDTDDEYKDGPRWLYWCTRRHVEWHSSMDETKGKKSYTNTSIGVLKPIEHSKLCVTPGITVGYNVGVDAKDVPVKSHQDLYASLVDSTKCYGKEKTKISNEEPCLDLVEDLLFCAIRSRTSTSAGMLKIKADPRSLLETPLMEKLWELMEERFEISRTVVEETQEFLIEHQRQIAYENLLGQCTKGHSCKPQAKEELLKFIQEGGEDISALEKEYPDLNKFLRKGNRFG